MRTPIRQLTVRLPAEDAARIDRMARLGGWRSRNELAGSIFTQCSLMIEAAHDATSTEMPRHDVGESTGGF